MTVWSVSPILLGIMLLAVGALSMRAGSGAGHPSGDPGGGAGQSSAKVVDWRIDNLARIGDLPVTMAGTPRVVPTEIGDAAEFNGTSDGLFLDAHPLVGLGRFTVEALFRPSADGPTEQRFLHFEEAETGNRMLLETRLQPDGRWCLDTFLRHGEASLTLIDRSLLHPSGGWHTVALTFDGETMTHYVDGARELSGAVAFKPLAQGRTSIGVRQNRVSWFKGRIRLIRITSDVVPPSRLLKPPATHAGD